MRQPKTFKIWSSNEDILLKKLWNSASTHNLREAFPDRTKHSLYHRARVLNIKCSNKGSRKRIGNFDFLDTLTTQSCYWWGFIMADGHISNRGELKVGISEIDKNHLEKLATHLGSNVTTTITKSNNYTKLPSTTVNLTLSDKPRITKWLDILKIKDAKTYSPPDLTIFLTKENLLPFFIGFVDGDGSIWYSRGRLVLGFQIHSSWLTVINTISSKLFEFYNIKLNVKLDNSGYTRAEIHRKDSFKVIVDLLPQVDYLERKWNKCL